MKRLLYMIPLLILSICGCKQTNTANEKATASVAQLSAEEQELCTNTFEAFLHIDSVDASKREEFYKFMLKSMGDDSGEYDTWYRENITHIDSVMRKSIELTQQGESKALLELLESELYNIYGHPNADPYNCWDLHAVLAMLYSKYIEDDTEYFAKLSELGEYSKMQIEAVQANQETPHPLYKRALEELLQVYEELGNESKVEEIQTLIKETYQTTGQ